MSRNVERLIYSFPVQLVLLHLRKNIALVAVWALLLVIVTQNFGKVLGVPYLFLDPEYLDTVGFTSFFLVGLSFGGMVIAFHITCYILYGYKYTFVGILEKPFVKFSINNSIIPLMVFLTYLIAIVSFQIHNEDTQWFELMLMLSGFISGSGFMIFILLLYFSLTNKDIFRFLAGSVDRRLKQVKLNRLNALHKLRESRDKRFRVDSYLDIKLRPLSTKGLDTFMDKEAVLKVFDQNHFNSVIIEVLILVLILILGFFMDSPYFKIPAAASAILIFTVVIMLNGAISYWFRSWALAVTIMLLALANLLVKNGILEGTAEAIGLKYNTELAEYNLQSIKNSSSPSKINADKSRTLEVLENWKQQQNTPKPKAVFLCVSGGGQRAALWSMSAMAQLDSVINGNLMNSTVLITGASGGMIGAAYYRELFLRHRQNQLADYNSQEFRQNIAKDNLNPIIFSLLVNDLFLRSQHFEHAGRRYRKDRGYAFEQQLNINTEGMLEKSVMSYALPEYNAEVPIMIMSPTIANDGRRLYISAQPVSYMNLGVETLDDQYKISGVDFMSFFQKQQSQDLRMLSALRMSASFPYITPNVELPSNPAMQIMDAGIADNFGISDALRFIYTFQDWLEENTSGVVLISIRDTRKNVDIQPRTTPSILQRLSAPISSVYNNLGNLQDVNNDNKIQFAKEWFNAPLDVVSIEYDTYTNIKTDEFRTERQLLEGQENERASLSWHLTSREKRNIQENIYRPENRAALSKIRGLVKP
ncbi:MAG: patatin-like phospholipase family protein [Cyclobacteriaceae bacterium]